MVHPDNDYRIRWVNAVFLWLSKVDTWSPMPCIAMVRIKHFVRTLSNVLIEFALFEMILTLNDSFKNKNYIFQWFIEPNSLQRAINNDIKDEFFFLSHKYICVVSHMHMNILRPWWAHYVARALEMSCNKLKNGVIDYLIP